MTGQTFGDKTQKEHFIKFDFPSLRADRCGVCVRPRDGGKQTRDGKRHLQLHSGSDRPTLKLRSCDRYGVP